MTRLLLAAALGLFAAAGCQPQSAQKEAAASAKPNVLLIYADDLGYGDLGANGQGRLATPNLDSLANSGVRFTNGYATSATCTPSRFALLTGTYPWRNKNAKILPGDAPLLIDTATTTLADVFRQQGYATGIVGKWHLGLGRGNLDWNQPLHETPNDLGFDYSYIMAATADRVPTVLVENGRVLGLQANDPLYVSYKENFPGEPTAISNPELMTKMKWHNGHNQSVHNGIPRIGYMKGGKAALWQDERLSADFLAKAESFIDAHRQEPFFLYYALHEPHVPRAPAPEFVGKSGLGPRGDAILEADWRVGQIIRKLKKEGLYENTLVIFSSDNGPVLDDGYYDEAEQKNGDHTPSGQFRGGKYSLLEAGTRVPFLVSWPGHIKPQVSDALVCQIDLLASLGALINSPAQAPDSQNLLDAFLGKAKQGRANLVLEASGRLAFRSGSWLYIPDYAGRKVYTEVKIETGLGDGPQLYDLAADPGQKRNLAAEQPARLTEIQQQMQQVIGDFQPNKEQLILR